MSSLSKSYIRFSLEQVVISMLFVMVLGSARGQYWMQRAGGVTIDEAYDVSIDGNGNSYTVGYFTGAATFGSTTLTSSGATDIFITKTDNQGNFIWTVKAGGTGSDRALAVITDGVGSSYVTGYFSDTATFGTQQLVSFGLQDIFIAKYSNTGVLLWAKKAGGPGADFGNGIAINANSVYVTGSYKDTATFGSTTLTSTNSTSDVFISKLNTNGIFQWTKAGKGKFSNRGLDLGCDNSGNVYVTGQFSDTITFDVTHNNTMQNVIFLVKYNGAGQEQWFRVIGAGASNIANAVAVDGSGNTYIAGDFTGSLTFFGSPNFTLTNTYSNKIFVAKYTNSGLLLWAKANGSNSELTARNLAIDGAGNSYLVGHFKCKLNEYADFYGQGTFNSVGFLDIYIAKFNASGTWQLSRNIGGRQDDKGYGIAVNAAGQIHVAGSFNSTVFIPVSANFLAANLANWTAYPCPGNSSYCSDSNYGNYYGMSSNGNSDILITRSFDPLRAPFDYYMRSGTACQRPFEGVCIDSLCPDTVTACTLALLTPIPKICSAIGPGLVHSWSGNSQPAPQPPQVYAFNSGIYWVAQTSEDGCFVSVDSIYADIIPPPTKPKISDDKGFNNDAFFPVDVEVCQPDSVLLTGSGMGTNTYWWTGPGLPAGGVYDSTIYATQTGDYSFNLIDSAGCENSSIVTVIVYPPLDSFVLKMSLFDTIEICEFENFQAQLYDSISNPLAGPTCLTDSNINIFANWSITPSIPFNETCETYGFFFPMTTGNYTISVVLIRSTFCETDTHSVSKSVYVVVNPVPIIPPFTITLTGNPTYCPGSFSTLTASGSPGSYLWFGPNVTGDTTSSVNASADGFYGVSSIVSDTNIFGCTSQQAATAGINVSVKPQPVVTASSLLICPNDSVLLTCTGNTGFFWVGPNGPISGNNSSIYATDQGLYFCVVNDTDSCGLVSNSVLLAQYATPMLIPSGDTFICDGDSTVISVVANDSSIIEWQPPLSGNSLSQTIYTPGVYTAKITSCGIETFASITITSSHVDPSITANGYLCKDSSVVLSGVPGMAAYQWSPGNDTTQSILVNSPGTYSLTATDTNGCTAISNPFVLYEIIVPANITSSDTVFCQGDSMMLMANPGMAGYFWSPTGDTNQTIAIFTAGTYGLTVTDTTGCQEIADAITLTVPDTVASIGIDGETHFCAGDSAILFAKNTGYQTMVWQPGNVQADTLVVYQSGNYWLTATDTNGCKAASPEIEIRVEPNDLVPPIVSSDTMICAGTDIQLFASTDSGTIYWYNPPGSPPVATGSYYTATVFSTTIYYLQTEASVCQSEMDSIIVVAEDCETINVPNVFTPNGDGINDFFSVEIFGATCFHVNIYNRWGILIYQMYQMSEAWDGTIQQTGLPAADGTYFYIIEYCKYDGSNAVDHGTITLLRN